MTIQEAIKAARALGKSQVAIRRTAHSHRIVYVRQPPDGYLIECGSPEIVRDYNPTVSDLLADDWEVLL